MDFQKFSAKTVSDAITEACKVLGVTSDKLDYVVKEEGSSGFLGIASRPAVIKARIKDETVCPVFLISYWNANEKSLGFCCRRDNFSLKSACPLPSCND